MGDGTRLWVCAWTVVGQDYPFGFRYPQLVFNLKAGTEVTSSRGCLARGGGGGKRSGWRPEFLRSKGCHFPHRSDGLAAGSCRRKSFEVPLNRSPHPLQHPSKANNKTISMLRAAPADPPWGHPAMLRPCFARVASLLLSWGSSETCGFSLFQASRHGRFISLVEE